MSLSFGEYLDAAMKANGYFTTASLARATGIGDSVLSKWLTGNGGKTPRTYMLRRLAPALNVPLLQLVVAAKIMTPEEAGMDGEPQPPKPVEDSEIEELIASSSMSDDRKTQLRAELIRLRQQAFDESRRTPVRRSRKDSPSGGNEDRRTS